MVPIRCGIVDDKPLAIEIISSYIEKVPFLSLTHATTNPLEALQWVEEKRIDLIFLDIQMPELTGVQFMKITHTKIGIILTTAYAEFALEGYEHNALDYLLKPVSFERFYKGALKAKQWYEHREATTPTRMSEEKNKQIDNSIREVWRDFMFVKTEHKLVKICFSDILYIEALQNYSILHTAQTKIMTLQSLKEISCQLSQESFIRVHKSYIINLSKIREVERGRVQIGTASIPIGDAYQNQFYKQIKHK